MNSNCWISKVGTFSTREISDTITQPVSDQSPDSLLRFQSLDCFGSPSNALASKSLAVTEAHVPSDATAVNGEPPTSAVGTGDRILTLVVLQ